MNRKDIGYDDFFESGRTKAGLGSFALARVIAEHRELYRVMSVSGERFAKITGKQIFTAKSREEYPAVGDWVAISELDAEHAIIHGVLPRKSVLKRKESGGSDAQIIATNVDVAFIVQTVGRDFSINRFERYAAMIASGGVRSGIILNKSDLIPKPKLDAIVLQTKSRLPEIYIVTTSAITEGGLDDLRATLEKGKTYCFVGSSGVGKSSIINALLGKKTLTTGKVNSRTNRGTHVTTSRSLFLLEGGSMVIDNPGMREVGVIDSESGIEDIFDEIVEIVKLCKFSDCTHTNESGCAVRTAIESGVLDGAQYESYEKLRRENEFHHMTDLEKRKKDRAFGKFIKKTKEQIRKYDQ